MANKKYIVTRGGVSTGTGGEKDPIKFLEVGAEISLSDKKAQALVGKIRPKGEINPEEKTVKEVQTEANKLVKANTKIQGELDKANEANTALQGELDKANEANANLTEQLTKLTEQMTAKTK